ncbi:MAG: hypothetical protein ABEJ79_11335 [Halolamina sp.]
MPKCPGCGDDTVSRMAIIDPGELTEDREYCLTCEKFVDDDARSPPDADKNENKDEDD